MRIVPRLALALVLALLMAGRAGSDQLELSLSPVGGLHRMFVRPVIARARPEPVVIAVTVVNRADAPKLVQVALEARDIFGKPAGWQAGLELTAPAGGKPAVGHALLDAGIGYFSVTGRATSGEETASAWTDVGVVLPPHPGLRKDSFFASNTSGLKTGLDAQFYAALGMKVQRVHFQPEVSTQDKEWWQKPSTGAALPVDYRRLDDTFRENAQLGVWALPICGYAFQGSGGDERTDLARALGMYGPPRDFREFAATWEHILRRYPQLTTIEVWNEPWIFGWTWAGTPAEYRAFQKTWCDMALKVNPGLRIIAGNSAMFVEDNIEPDPAAWKGLISGTTHHPYGYGTGQPDFRGGDQFRSMDYGMQLTRRMGLKYYYLTEGGTQYNSPLPPEIEALQAEIGPLRAQMGRFPSAEDKAKPEYKALQARLSELQSRLRAVQSTIPSPQNNIENACKVVQYFVRLALLGGYQGNAQWEIGYGPGWTRANTAVAVMTHFLEDRPVVADVWPGNELVTGAIFANSRWVTDEVRRLPRADELSARWDVPVPDEGVLDDTKVAVVYALTGPGAGQLDTGGTLSIENSARDLRAYDMTGREIRSGARSLVVPLAAAPVYIVGERPSVIELRARLASAVMENITPLNLYVMPLAGPADEVRTVTVRVENQLNRPVSGTLNLKVAGAAAASSAPLSIQAGRLADVAVPWPATAVSPLNQYDVTVTAALDAGDKLRPVSHRQLIQTARIAKRSIAVDGKLDDWKGVVPVVVDSRLLNKDVDLTMYLLNPGMDRPTGADDETRIVARVFTAYDDRNVYVAAEVHERSYACHAGEPVEKGRGKEKVTLPYKTGMPGGLNHVVFMGDVLEFAFGFRDRVPGHGRTMDDPYAWKGHFYDTDYVYYAHGSTEGDMLVRQWGADTARRNGYQTEQVPGLERLADGRIRIVRDEERKLTVYELAIPRTELRLFDPSADHFRFGFILCNDERLGELNWSETAGVFDFWRNMGSFAPTWMQRLPCQTWFGIER